VAVSDGEPGLSAGGAGAAPSLGRRPDSREPLRRADPDAVVRPARRRGEATATAPVEVAAEKSVMLAYTCTDLYLTAMGRTVFRGEIVRSLLGFACVMPFI
jgi:hypothetical protein